ncbi:Cytochrome c7 c [uncultured archaeon]|nr:Cytochrome c7 c [uncultured archaeon]
MNKKLFIIVILVLIVTTLSQTVSFITGEHGFYQTVQDKCVKCHGDIKVQLSASANHSYFSCTSCHAKSSTNHTNVLPKCEYCHAVPQLNDTFEAHTGFSNLSSEGCIACHSTYNVLLNYSRAEYIDYTITDNAGDWIISNFATVGTLNLSYNAMRQGGNHNMKAVSCKDCHKDIFDAVSLNGHAVVLDRNGTQVVNHSISGSTDEESWCRTCHNRNDSKFPSQQHAARKTTCDECHQAYGDNLHPGNFYTNIQTVPHLYRSLVCISCKSAGWPAPNATLHFRVHEEPYFDVVVT